MTMYSSISIHESKKSIRMLTRFCLVADFLAELMWMCERIEGLFFLLYCCGESCRELHREFLRLQHSLIPHPTFFLPSTPTSSSFFFFLIPQRDITPFYLPRCASLLANATFVVSFRFFPPHLSLKCDYVLIIFQANGLSAQKGN